MWVILCQVHCTMISLVVLNTCVHFLHPCAMPTPMQFIRYTLMCIAQESNLKNWDPCALIWHPCALVWHTCALHRRADNKNTRVHKHIFIIYQCGGTVLEDQLSALSEREVYLAAISPKLAEQWVSFMDCTTEPLSEPEQRYLELERRTWIGAVYLESEWCTLVQNW